MVSEFFHVDWTSRARRKIGVPVLHLLEHENFDEQAGSRRGRHRPVTAAGIFLTHQDSPRIRRHFARLVAETGDLVDWHFVLSHDAFPRPEAPFPYDDPAEVLPTRYRAMAEHGGVQGGYLDTLLVPVLRGLCSEEQGRPRLALRVRRGLRRAVGRPLRAGSPTTRPTC